MLKTLKLHNFRTYLNAQIDFEMRHLIIGRNNSGKSNLLRGMRFLSAAATGDLAQAVNFIPGGAREIRNWHVKSDLIELACRCELPLNDEGLTFEYELDLRLREGPRLEVRRESLKATSDRAIAPSAQSLFNGNDDEAMVDRDGKRVSDSDTTLGLHETGGTSATMLSRATSSTLIRQFRAFLAGWRLYTLNPDAMRSGWRRAGGEAMLAEDGANLAQAVFQLKNADELRYRRLIERVRLIEPDLAAFNFVVPPGQSPVPFVVMQRGARSWDTSWESLSDGTLRLMAMAYLVEAAASSPASQPGPTMTLIEEPENGIAPNVLRSVFNFFDEQLPQTQCMFTSHSPYFIDLFDGERNAVLVLKKGSDRTETHAAGPVEADPDRLTLSQEYATELIG